MAPQFVPDRGDVVWLSFDPQVGREQSGRRPALIVSPLAYNRTGRLALACPITNQAKDRPFEVPLESGAPVTGVILCDHLKSIDWVGRQARMIGSVDSATVRHVLDQLSLLLSP